MFSSLSRAVLPTDDQIRFFKTEGYLIIKNALSDEKVQKLNQAIEESHEKFNIEHKEKTYIKTRSAIITEHDEFLDLIELKTTFPTIVRLLQHYNIQLLLSQLIENHPHHHERAIGWHMDGGHPIPTTDSGEKVMHSLKIGYALSDVDKDDMGSLEIVPKSHKMNFKHYDGIKNKSYQGDFPNSIQLKLRSGDAFIFDQRLWHASSRNKTDKTRVALYYGYGYAQLKPLDYLTMPSHILEKCTPIGQQLLGKRLSKFTAHSYYDPEEVDVPLKKWYADHFGESWIK